MPIHDPVKVAREALHVVVGYLHPDNDKHSDRARSSVDSILEKLVSELSPERHALVSLRNNIYGSWSAFETDLRYSMGNTNYQIVKDLLEETRALIAATPAVSDADAGGAR